MSTDERRRWHCTHCGEHLGLRPTADPRAALVLEHRRDRERRVQDCWVFHAPCRDSLRARGELDARLASTPPTYEWRPRQAAP